MERGWREMAPTCPRCGSSNTKFCYYNNYSLTQPRYFCKGCRRYWTKGGSLRNVPVGGGCRKSRRSRSSTLRLATTPSNHRHNNTPMYSHNDHHLGGHASYGNMSNMGDDSTTSPINSEVPTIDLAAVYANYLNQKPEISTSEEVPTNCRGYNNNNNNNPTLVELSNIPDATQIAPTSQVVLQQHNTFVHCNDITMTNNNKNRLICPTDDDNNNHPSFSQTVLPMSELMSNIDHQNQVLYVTEFSRPILNDEMSMQAEHLGLLPLPGEALMSQDHYNQQHQHMPPWPSPNLTVVDSNLQVPTIRHHLQDLESEPQFSTMFNNNGSWSPLDLQGFETTTSSSKP